MERMLTRGVALMAVALVSFPLIAGIRGTTVGATRRLPEPALDEPLAKQSGRATAVVAGGCFWGIQLVFQHVKGVISATSGYAGGDAKSANYPAVSSHETKHAESVQIVYDPSQITYGQLLKVFFSVAHDPTELNRQGPDMGPQYRSALFVSNDEQRKVAAAYIAQLGAAKVFDKPIVTEVVPLPSFYQAEDYHQNYATLHPDEPYIAFNDRPKLEHLKTEWPALYNPADPRR